MISKLLSIDLSTTCTGFSVFDIETKNLLDYRAMRSSIKGLRGMVYPELTLNKMVNFAKRLREYILKVNPKIIVIEEIAGSKNRIGQKTLDGMHWILLKNIPEYIKVVYYYDVTGRKGWRTDLKLRLTDADKATNKEYRKLNKNLEKGTKKLPIIGPKHLAARYVNHAYDLSFNVDLNSTDNDIADSIGMGSAFLQFKLESVLLALSSVQL